MGANLMLSNLRRTNVELLQTSNALSTGKRVNNPSDDPGAIGSITTLRKYLQDFNQRLSNLGRAGNIVDVTDQALGEATDQLQQAASLATSQIGVGSDTATRKAQASIIDGILDSMFNLANREHQGVSLFGGKSSSATPFVSELGGYRYVGARQNLNDDLTGSLAIDINSNGVDAFGALSNRVEGSVDLNPDATATTRLANVNGARGKGVTLGTITIDVNGTQTNVDLSAADTLGDVANLVNNALGAAGSLAVTANGFTLTAGAGNTITISDSGAAATAADLGVGITATAGSTAGGDVDPKLTLLTDLGQLGAAVNLAGGVKITNGATTKIIDTSTASTVQDLINAFNTAGVGVRLEINEAGTGLNLVNEVSGIDLSIGENAGGTTATGLGIRSLNGSTQLSDFRNGQGVRTAAGLDDFRIDLADGSTSILVNLDGATTVGDVIAAINTAGGGSVTASLAADGNGIALTDNIGGASDFKVVAVNDSFAAEDLGIRKNVGTASTLTGDDHAKVRSESVFTHLVALRDALLNDDTAGLTLAGQAISGDIEKLTTERAKTGVRSNQISAETSRVTDRQVSTQSLLSNIQDTDYASAITRLTQLQQQLQANLSAGARILQLSLLDFLQ